MRIAFDGSTLRPHRTGVGYYTEHLLHHLARATTPDDTILVISNRPVDTTMPLPRSVQVIEDRWRLPRTAWMQARVPALLRELEADVAHFTNGMMPLAMAVPTVVTIHDLSLRVLPRCHPRRRVMINRPLMDLAARRADAVITVSQSARGEIVDFYRLDDRRVHVVYEAAAPSFAPVTDPAELERVRRTYGLADRVILYVGTIEPRKNLPILIDAFAGRRHAGALDHQLVCVGPYGWLSRGIHDVIARSLSPEAIAFTGYVPFKDLPALYSAAEMFVYPSMYEGFGLPVIEAMACGVPVVTGGASAVAEVGAHAVDRVDSIDADTLGDALVRLARDPDRRIALAEAGLARAREFSWTRAAAQSLEIYREVAATRRASVRSRGARGSHPGHEVSEFASLTPIQQPASSGSTDVLFGQAYTLRFDPKLWSAQQPYAPLGTLYAASLTREHGYQVALHDAMLADSENEWAAALDRHRPRVAVIYEDNFNYLSKMCLLRMRQAALTMIAAAVRRRIPVVVSGSDASDHPAVYLDRGAAIVVVGEGEMTLVEVLDALLRGVRSIETVAGICRRDGDGRLTRTRPREIIRNLDALPFPAWDLVDVDRYRRIWRSHHGFHSMNLATTRGCPYHCNWCAKPIYGQRYATRSPGHVVDEIAWLKRHYAPDHLWIADDIFGLTPGWIEGFAALVEERDARVPFKCLLRADQVTPEIARALRRSGCQTAWIGAESGSQRVLDAMEKGTRVDQIHAATGLLRGAGIEVGFFLQFGYPGETRDDIDKTLAMIRTCNPDDIGVSVSYPLPGTTFYQRVKAQLGLKQNWVDSSDLAMMYQATYVPDFYRALHALVHAEFRARRATDLIGAFVRGPRHARPHRLRTALHDLARWASVPVLRRRVDRLAKVAPSQPAVLPMAVLSPQAAALPTEQPRA